MHMRERARNIYRGLFPGRRAERVGTRERRTRRRLLRYQEFIIRLNRAQRAPCYIEMISGRTCVFCATARANSSSGAGSSGVMLAPPAAPPPTVLLRGLTGPPVEDGQLPTGFPPPMDSRFPKAEEDTHVKDAHIR